MWNGGRVSALRLIRPPSAHMKASARRPAWRDHLARI
jgi:hypothetical protein